MRSNNFKKALGKLEKESNSANSRVAKAHLLALQNLEPSSRSTIISKEVLIRDAISLSCVQWVKNGQWPIMEPDAELLAWERVSRAINFGNWLAERGFESSAMTDDEFLVWLMVECWTCIYVFQWSDEISKS